MLIAGRGLKSIAADATMLPNRKMRQPAHGSVVANSVVAVKLMP